MVRKSTVQIPDLLEVTSLAPGDYFIIETTEGTFKITALALGVI